MGELGAFLKINRAETPERAPSERVGDHREFVKVLPSVELKRQGARCMACGVPFCHHGCPLGNLIPDWNVLVYRERFAEAIEQLHRTNNFPEFTGRLCPAPCEAACVLEIDEGNAVTIKQIELAIVSRGWDEGWIVPQPPATRTGRSVAVVGSGPAGLACAQQLNRAGHHVTVFERDEAGGGLLRFGVPDFKIEKWVIERRLEQLAAEGVELRYGLDVTPWPLWPMKLRTSYALKEGGERSFAISTTGLSGNGRVQEIHWARNSGTPPFDTLPGTDESRPAQLVLLAMGFVGPEPGLLDGLGVDRDPRGNGGAPQ